SHASALISTVSSGGKDPRATRAGSLFEARQSLLEEALAPLADHLAPGVQARGDLVIVHAIGCHQDHLGPDDLEIWQRIFGRAATQFCELVGGQLDSERTLPRHKATPRGRIASKCHTRPDLAIEYVAIFKKLPT